MRALVERSHDPAMGFEVVAVVADQPGAGGLAIARDLGVPTHVVAADPSISRARYDEQLAAAIEPRVALPVAQPAGAIPAHGHRVDAMLEHLHACRQTLRIVLGLDADSRLNHRGPRVEFWRHEVDRGAVLLVARFERALMSMQPRILGQQRRVNVEDASCVAGHELARENAHEAGEHDQRRGAPFDLGGQGPIIAGAVFGFGRRQRLGRDAHIPGGSQSGCVGLV